ncbi:MAG: DegT/DnrJ/EryC1/StrS family aminotransferase, partial [Planctomycetota bacterium]
MEDKVQTVPFFDCRYEFKLAGGALERAVEEVLSVGRFILGPEVTSFEEAAARHVGVDHAVGLASGTDALELALRALDIG